MDVPRVSLTPSQLQDRMTEARLWLDNLDEKEATYGSKRMIGESRVSNLQEAWKDTVDWEKNHREHEENLRSAQEMNAFLPVVGDQQRPHSSHETMSHTAGFAPYAGSSVNTFGGHFASDGAMAGQGRPAHAPTWNFGSENTTGPGTPSFSNGEDRPSSASASTPGTPFTIPRKRQRGSLSMGTEMSERSSKARRPTPSPSMTPLIQSGATTPSSYAESLGIANDIPEDLFGLFGGDPTDAAREFRDSWKEQQEHMRAVEARRQQELADEEFARSLQEELNGPSFPTTVPGAGSSNFPSSQSYLDAQGHLRRPVLISSSPAPISSDPFDSLSVSLQPPKTNRPPSLNTFEQETPYSTSSNDAAVKRDHSYQSTFFDDSMIGMDNIINLDSDEEYDNLVPVTGAHPSNDLVETDAHSWPFSSGRGFPGSFPSGSSASANTYNNRNQNLGSWNTITNTAQGLVNNVYNTVGQTVSKLGNTAGLGSSAGYGMSSAGSAGVPIIDLENNDNAYQNFYQRRLDQLGLNPTDSDLVARYRERYDYIAHDPTRTAREMKELLENIRPDEDLAPENREGTPAAMVYPLMEHQKLGVAWMRRMEEGTNKGGILADDMGLGKTIQALALMVSRRSSNPARKTTLIVCPVALLRQWAREIDKKLKPGRQHSLTTFIFHGPKVRPSYEKLKTFDVVLTTFGVVSTELKRRGDIELAKKNNPNWRPTSSKDVLSLLGDECYWYRVIIDEAQCIKNRNAKAAVGCCMLQADHRFCMTGTPMMNNVGELFSLIRLLRIRPYCEWEKFRHDIERPLKGQSDSLQKKAMKQLQALLKSLLLRRTKKSEIDGKPILDLPPRTTTVQHASFSEDETSFYKALEMNTQLQFNKYLKAGTVGRNYSNILVLLLRLRQACCHPHLLKDFAQSGGPADISAKDMIKLAKELKPDVVNRIKEQAEMNDSTHLECPICMDPTDNATIFIPCGHDTCSECFARITDPSQAVAEGVDEQGPRKVKCPNCRAEIVPSRVIDFASFKKVYMPQPSNENGLDDPSQAEIDTSDDSDSDSDSDESDDDDDDVDNKGNLRGFIVNDDDFDEPTEVEGDDSAFKKPSKPSKKKSKGKGKATEKKGPKKTLAQLKKAAGIGSKARQKYLKKLAKDWQTSAKIEKTMEILGNLQAVKDEENKQCEKTIVFSQFTSLLDLLELPINEQGWKYRRYDGSMSPTARNDAVLAFTDNPDVKIMLVSLKAGNSGLNLVAASQVIVFDPFWNPYIEEQAIDRAHRIGQLKPVQVHRLLVPNTVEDRIIALQEQKRKLIESALDEKASQSIGRLGTRELAFLFDVNT